MKIINNTRDFNVIKIETELTEEMFKKLQKHAPEALVILNSAEDEIFRIKIGDESDISEYGIVFDKFDEETGKAFILINTNKTIANEELAEDFGKILIYLKDLEDHALDAYVEINSKILAVASLIEGGVAND